MARNDRKRDVLEFSADNRAQAKRETSVDTNLAEEMTSARVSTIKDEPLSRSNSPHSTSVKVKTSHSSNASTPRLKSENDDSGAENGVLKSNKVESPDVGPRPSRKASRTSKKPIPRVAPLFSHLSDATDEANQSYQVIKACQYQNKYLGYTEHAMECDCNEEWDSTTKTNLACGEDSDCINRATKMECVGDCVCGDECQNQRFLRCQYANVSVIKTDKKGFGLRANTHLKHGDFIFEYIGEVIPEGTFRKRMRQYDEEGIKHFYFMSLSKGEFVDATKKGNLGRFCNHSCNPNCYVDKWVVGDKLRMGIFAERSIQPGEELVFNYNVDRYGANPQPCYCGESNCTGFIGGKTQTERGTKLSAATIEALGIDDEDWDTWDTITAKKPKKKKTTTDEDDEDYVERAEARDLDIDGVTKVMAALMQCKEKWIAVKLLQRMQRCQSEEVLHRIIKLHGYKILNSQLSAWREDENVVLQILEILDKLPRLTRNKIVDAKIDQTLEPLKDSSDERVATKATTLLDEWSKLELAYRIPRKVRTTEGGADVSTPVKYERRESQQARKRSKSRSRSRSPPKGPSGKHIPTGPRGTGSRPTPFTRPSVPLARGPPPLPAGWFQATDESGRAYFYSATGETTWKRPSQPASKPPPPPKQPSQQDMLKSIIDGIVTSSDKTKDNKTPIPETPEAEKQDNKIEKWRTLDEEKQKKLYEHTLYPHISHVMNKYKHKIPKDDLKRFAKDLAKKLVNSDYKAGRIDNPTKISEKQQKKVKAYCKDFFDKAAAKHKKFEEDRAVRKAQRPAEGRGGGSSSHAATPVPSPRPTMHEHSPKKEEEDDEDEDVKMSDIEDHNDHDKKPLLSPSESVKNGSLKRKRSTDLDTLIKDEDDELTKSPVKRVNVETTLSSQQRQLSTPPPPPPPPAPPADTPPAPSLHDSPDDLTADHERDHNHDHDHVHENETDIHADTNFRGKSMADVLAQAQQEGDDEVDWGVEDEEEMMMKTENLRVGHGRVPESEAMGADNPLIDGQDVVVKREEAEEM